MSIRLSKALSELNIGLQTAVEFLEKRKDGDGEKFGPTSKLTDAQYSALVEAFKQDAAVRTEAEKLFQKKPKEKKHSSETKDSNNESLLASSGKQEYKPLGKIDLDSVGKPAAKQSGATKQDNTPQPKAAAVSQAKENKSEDKAPVAKTHAQHKTTEVKPTETAKAEKPATGTKEAHKSAKPAAEAKPKHDLLCKASKCLLNLLCYIYLVYFKRLLWTVAVFLLLALVVIIVTIIIIAAAIIGRSLLRRGRTVCVIGSRMQAARRYPCGRYLYQQCRSFQIRREIGQFCARCGQGCPRRQPKGEKAARQYARGTEQPCRKQPEFQKGGAGEKATAEHYHPR